MIRFFHRWRRSVGVCTLVLACVLMAGWIRSYSHDRACNLAGYRLALSQGVLELGSPSLYEDVDTFCYVVILSFQLLPLIILLTAVSTFFLVCGPIVLGPIDTAPKKSTNPAAPDPCQP